MNNKIKINEIYQYAWDKGMLKKLIKSRQDLKEILSLQKYKTLKKENPEEYKQFYKEEINYIKTQERRIREKLDIFYLNIDIVEEMEENGVFKVLYDYETINQFNNVHGEYINVLKDIYLSWENMYLYIRTAEKLICNEYRREYKRKKMIKFKSSQKIKKYII